jgi:hypothetical protein
MIQVEDEQVRSGYVGNLRFCLFAVEGPGDVPKYDAWSPRTNCFPLAERK